MKRRDVFQALADPTRREIISILSDGAVNVNQLADHFEISRPAISKQVKLLEECGLVKVMQNGRERYCVPTLEPLQEVSHWLDKYREFWTGRLDRLEEYLNKINTDDTESKK